MLPAFPSAFKLGRWSRLAILPVLLLLAACQTGGNSSGAAGPGRVQVALLVPSGSPDHNVNQVAASLSQAAQLAVSERGGDLVDLRIYSTAGDAAQAASVAQQAVNEGANVILGPLYAQNAAAVGRAVAGRGVSVLSFSNNTDIAGGNVFVLGNTFENTARRVADFAARRGKGRMIVVHGQTPAETFAKDAVAKVAPSTRASVVGSIGFEFSQEGVNTATPQIITTAQTQGAQAILLTSDTGGALPAITGALKDNGLPEVVQLIGLTRWDIPSSATSLPGLQNGWF
ncbi:MAG: ABC transporter substrate-binding protein, partial [Mangrovicoccus sp.]